MEKSKEIRNIIGYSEKDKPLNFIPVHLAKEFFKGKNRPNWIELFTKEDLENAFNEGNRGSVKKNFDDYYNKNYEV